jgi:hypothetical protein
MKKKRFHEFLKSFTVRREKRLLFIPSEVLMKGDEMTYLRAVSRSLPDVVVLRREFFKRGKKRQKKKQ